MMDLLDHLLVLDPKKRYSAKEVLQFYFKEYYNDNLNANCLDLEKLENPFYNGNPTNIKKKTFESKCKNLIRKLKKKIFK